MLFTLGACGHGTGGGGRAARAPLLIQEERLADAAVERNRTGRVRRDVAALRERLCEGHEDDPVIFYQLVVSRHWHYYWVCSSTRVKRAATRRGVRILESWLRKVKKRAGRESAECEPGNADKMFRERHESGIVVHAYCDGVMIVRYPDRSKITITYRGGGGGGTGRTGGNYPSVGPVQRSRTPVQPPRRVTPTGPGVAVSPPTTTRCPTCPPQRACPPQRGCPPQRSCPPQRVCPRCPPRRICPRCPPPKPCPRCPAPNTKETCKVFGEKAFWHGVKSACQRICTSIYKKCRSINPKTAMCYQLSEYCATLRGVCGKR